MKTFGCNFRKLPKNDQKLVTNDGFGRVEFFNHNGDERMEFNGSNINIQNAPVLIQQSLKIGTGTSAPSATLEVNGTTRITDLSGTGNRMVVADADGDLSTQAIATNTFVYHTPSIVGPLPTYDGTNYATIITLTAPSDGLYWLSLHTLTSGASNGSMYPAVMALTKVYKNGSAIGGTSNISQHNIGKALTLVAGDVIVFKCASNTGGGYANNSHGYLQKIQ